MWYVVQVRTGTEENICIQCRKNIDPDVLRRSFIPTYEEARNIRGEWTLQKKHLFPGYVFMETQDADALFVCLKNVLGLTKLLGTGDDVIPLTEKEVRFLKDLGGEEANVPMSEGIIEGGKITVVKGPLAGMEGSIRRIDRHRRKAWIEAEMFGRLQLVEVGLEVVAKK